MGGPGHQWGVVSSPGNHSVPVLSWLWGSEHPISLSPMEYLGSCWAIRVMT